MSEWTGCNSPPDDSPQGGGAGARKGLAKLNDNGELEIVENSIPTTNYPVDFSKRKLQIYYKLEKEKKNK